MLTATEPETPMPDLDCDVWLTELDVEPPMFPDSFPLSTPSWSTERILACQLDRSELLRDVPSEPWVPPVPGLACLGVPVSGLLLGEAIAPETAKVPTKPPFSAWTRTLPPKVKLPLAPETVSPARSPTTAWVSRLT
ncbi:MAG: hypothetical protein A4E73_00368 [Syntrophaceae bacterium PtaU1.Bin231]|nr:MAG: hypothetical protein A4E73_00368 [Syntrophaceae bacterium PtaU1.Bin231]